MKNGAVKSLSARIVHQRFIEALVSHLIDALQKQGTVYKEKEIRWVIPISSSSMNRSEEFVRSCAEQVRILSV